MPQLCITRRVEESIVIGDPMDPVARVMVTKIRGGQVRLTVTADSSVPVHRQEVAEKIKKVEAPDG